MRRKARGSEKSTQLDLMKGLIADQTIGKLVFQQMLACLSPTQQENDTENWPRVQLASDGG
jgi:hypothetical protein